MNLKFKGQKLKKEKKDVTVQVDTIREEMPAELKKKLFPDESPDSCQNMSTETKKGLRESS